MQNDILSFLNRATLMFVASRNNEGHLDVTPRGGQPSVMRVDAAGRWLLPDYRGNRRLDTIGNLLSNPEIALLVLNQGSSKVLSVNGTAEPSFSPEDLKAFPEDENPPLGVIIITPERCRFIETDAFAKAGFWIKPEENKAPLDLSAMISEDKKVQAAAGLTPVQRLAHEEQLLKIQGVREIYGPSSAGVQSKVSCVVGPSTRRFMAEARFAVIAHIDVAERIAIDLSAEAPLSVRETERRQACVLNVASNIEIADQGEIALTMIAPGRNEILRANGRFVQNTTSSKSVEITPREIYFHCPASLNRSRVWQDSRRVPWTGRRRFVCKERVRESPDVVSFNLKPTDSAPVGHIPAGSYVTLSMPGLGGEFQRSYSVSGQTDDRELRLSIRRMGHGGLSDKLHDTLFTGDTVLLGIPAGRFTLASPSGRRVALIGAGVGATPLVPMLRELAIEKTAREVWYIHAARDPLHHLFDAEARAIADTAKSASIILKGFYSRTQDDGGMPTRRLKAADIAEWMPLIDTDFYLCGPPAFMSELRHGLIELGAEPQAIRQESFVPSAVSSLSSTTIDREPCQVRFARSDLEVQWAPKDGSLLDLALAHGVKVAYSCRTGDCQSCLQRLLEGAATYPNGVSPVLGQGQVLFCQAIPRGDIVVDC